MNVRTPAQMRAYHLANAYAHIARGMRELAKAMSTFPEAEWYTERYAVLHSLHSKATAIKLSLTDEVDRLRENQEAPV